MHNVSFFVVCMLSKFSDSVCCKLSLERLHLSELYINRLVF